VTTWLIGISVVLVVGVDRNTQKIKMIAPKDINKYNKVEFLFGCCCILSFVRSVGLVGL